MIEQPQGNTDLFAGKNVSILIVDDHPMVRRGLKNLIGTQGDMKVVGEACNGIEAIKLAKKLLPNVIIMDIAMPIMDGLEATRQIKSQCPDIAVLVLTVHTDQEHILGILKAGAAGYLTKLSMGDDVINSIRTIISGETVIEPLIMQQILNLVKAEQSTKPTITPINGLSSREILILNLAASGLSNKSISIKTNLKEQTVKSHLKDIFAKMNVSSRTEAVITALKTGIISLQDLN
jgi:two-component system, NarL family, response regulator LiaR